MGTAVPEVLADPIGVTVSLVVGIETGLDRPVVEAVVTRVAGGRAKRRKLAQAVTGRPAVLADGRSPAPRVVGDLLIALVSAGAVTISPPLCAECGKTLRTLQRRGEHWYCGACGPLREPCVACARTKPVHSRDRDGRPHCDKCPLPGGGDPVDIVIGVLAAIDPALSPQAVAAAVRTAVPAAGRRHQLAWTVQDRPELLAGAGAEAAVPSVLRLIDALCDAGANGVVRPPCPHCGRVIPLVKPRGGVRLCRACVAKSRAEPCFGCGRVGEAATRDEQGRALCPNCLVSDPANLEVCLNCGRRRVVNTRTAHGPLCSTCPPLPTSVCSICAQQRPCGTSRLTGLPWCPSCQRQSARCARCGRLEPVRSGTLTEPLCQDCTVAVFPDCAA